MRLVSSIVVVSALGVTLSCTSAREREVDAAIGSAVAAHKSPDVHAFYKQQSGRPIWVDDKPTRAVKEAFTALKRANEHGLDPERYHTATLEGRAATLEAAKAPGAAVTDLVQFELDVTTALVALGRDVARGQSSARAPESARAPIDIGAKLAEALNTGALGTWPDSVRPLHPQYAALQKLLASGGQPPDRVKQIANAMNGWRLLPDDLGARHIIVNIPQFHLFVRDGGKTVVDTKVVVGKEGDETPVFSADMTSVILSPYWNIPESIAEGETIPSIIKDPAYLAKNNLEVLRRSGGKAERVDPGSVDWSDPEETEALSLRQKPGPGNALGHVKFMLPNKHSVYLHDTPAHALFDRRGRAFSHGCVRLEEPAELAKYVLGDDPAWTDAAIREAMHAGVEQEVKLKRPIPVHIVYFTAWVDDAGTPQFFGDVYRRNR
jgi:murein L,D-transpeptidase YcbB/YkuD